MFCRVFFGITVCFICELIGSAQVWWYEQGVSLSVIRSFQKSQNTEFQYKGHKSRKETPDAPDPDSSPSLLHAKSITVVTDRGFMNSCLFYPALFREKGRRIRKQEIKES
jgi:hypothetical protein